MRGCIVVAWLLLGERISVVALLHNSPGITLGERWSALAQHRKRREAGETPVQRVMSAEEASASRRTGERLRRLEKAARREDRIEALLVLERDGASSSSPAEQAELAGLLRARESFEEQYDASSFTPEHVDFKRQHNEAFASLALRCHNNGDGGYSGGKFPNVFYLDGPDAATTTALVKRGFPLASCFVANRHASTVEILRGILPSENVAHATAAEALTSGAQGGFAELEFAAYYFDGCGGFAPHVVGMMRAALLRPGVRRTLSVAVGFSLTGGRSMIERELVICRALSEIAGIMGMRTRHAMDDPARYEMPRDILKTEGKTFTTWMLLEEDK
ncbi:hypothetical protein THAOC_01383 [Thalassiosira oceanica]|uniref:Uncharacterized protein n=1 Tax=Thalassiosira oceanica TaxID=159749 RepID=K0TDP8_THAOC|nr:hypothetical protein THAOC_01383 [Thalassiosira oceanica]|eukprot:EJK76833.1 hypothetical protein THAOC_01383 [Thalassiosira oceanica]